MTDEKATTPESARSPGRVAGGALFAFTLFLVAALTVVSSTLPGKDRASKAAQVITFVAAICQIEMFALLGEKYGFTRRRMMIIGYAVMFLAIGVVAVWNR